MVATEQADINLMYLGSLIGPKQSFLTPPLPGLTASNSASARDREMA